jgi:hypothetical protein
MHTLIHTHTHAHTHFNHARVHGKPNASANLRAPQLGISQTVTVSSWGSSSTDDEITNDFAALLANAAVDTSPTLFGGDELNSDNQCCVDATVGVRDYLATVRATPSLFQTRTNFTAN